MDPVLYRAVRSGEISFLERLTEDEETWYFSQLTPTENTLFHIAAEFEQAEFFKKVCLKCDPSLIWQPNSKLETPLHVAATVGCLEIVWFLVIEHNSFHVSVSQAGRQQNVIRQKNRDGDTALNCAVRYGHKDIVECLMEKDPELSSFSNYVDESPLYLSVSNSFIDIAMLIIRLSPSSISYLGPKGLTPLHVAISRISASTTNMELAEEVIKKRPEAMKEADDVLGWTPFHFVASWDIVEALKLLLKYDIDLSAAYNLDRDGNTALHVAACWGSIGVIKELTKSRPDISELTNKKAETALHIAVLSGQVKVVEYMLRDPQFARLLNEPDKEGNTPLHIAVLFDKISIIAMLAKETRVNVNAINKDFKAPADINFVSYRKPGFTTLKMDSLFRKSNSTRCMQHFFNDEGKKWLNRTPELKPNFLGFKEDKDEQKRSYKKYPEVYLLVASIITTASFSAAFAMPGGYITKGHDKGKPILVDQAAFKAFVVFDIIAFCFSLSAVYFQKATAISERMRLRYQSLQTRSLSVSMIALAFAFASGLYVTLANSNLELSSVAYMMLCSLLLVFSAVWCIDPFGGRKLIQKHWSIGKYRIQLFRSKGGRLLPVCACSVKK